MSRDELLAEVWPSLPVLPRGGWRMRFRPPLGGRCRLEAGAPNPPAAREAGGASRVCCERGWGRTISTASRRSMPAGSRRSESSGRPGGRRCKPCVL